MAADPTPKDGEDAAAMDPIELPVKGKERLEGRRNASPPPSSRPLALAALRSGGGAAGERRGRWWRRSGRVRPSRPQGGRRGRFGVFISLIQLAESEFVKEVSGTLDEYEGETVVASIKLVTNVKAYGPYGGKLRESEKTKPFNVPVQSGSAVVGFFGRGGKYLNAIGVYVAPL
ncbi:hypothetical protein EJB05_14290, partial [Eragrostis curvula]